MTISGGGGTAITASMASVVHTGQVTGKRIVFSGNYILFNMHYQGSINSPTSMGGTYFRPGIGETCRWSASRLAE